MAKWQIEKNWEICFAQSYKKSIFVQNFLKTLIFF